MSANTANTGRKRRQPGDGKAAEEKKQAAKDKKAVEDIEVKALLALMQIVKRPLTPPYAGLAMVSRRTTPKRSCDVF
jgi:hypothetical protein